MSASKEDIKDFNIIFHEIKSLRDILNQSPDELYKNSFDSDIDLITAILQSSQNAREAIENQIQFSFSSIAQRKIRDIANRKIGKSNQIKQTQSRNNYRWIHLRY